jgi:hypothetical protein
MQVYHNLSARDLAVFDWAMLAYFSVRLVIRMLGERAYMTTENAPKTPPKFGSMLQTDVPTGRNGKHKEIVAQLLNDIAQLEPGNALKVPLNELPDTKENIRSALNRATRERGLSVATSSDNDYLYVWKP